MKAHQEYQRGLRAFEEWLEQEQEKLGCYTQLEGDVDMLEETLQKLQVLKYIIAVIMLLSVNMKWHNNNTTAQQWLDIYHNSLESAQQILVITGTAASLHRGPGFTKYTAGQSRAGHSLGSATD